MKLTRYLFRGIALLLALLALAPAAMGRINVVTLPGRDAVQLTIYNSADLTMVRETRVLTFRKGLNRLEFSWANTFIDPTSVEFRALTHADAVDVLDVSFPARVTNTLEWRIASEVAGEVTVEIRYFTSGISWAADYVAEADTAEKLLALAGSVRVTNNSGEDYEETQVRLVVGVIHLVEEIANLARTGRPATWDMPMTERLKDMDDGRLSGEVYRRLAKGEKQSGDKPREVIKEGLSEYFLYTVEGRDTIPTGWSKRLPSFRAADVPLVSYYKFERERWGDSVIRYYRFKNDKASKLGNEPLPDGAVKAFRFVTPDKLYAFVGRTNVKYIPINEQVELELGNDREVLVKPKLMDWAKTDLHFDANGNVAGWTIKETWEFEIQNSKPIAIQLDIRRNFAGDWDMKSASPFEKVDVTKVKFVLPLQPREKHKFSYELTTRYGTNVTR